MQLRLICEHAYILLTAHFVDSDSLTIIVIKSYSFCCSFVYEDTSNSFMTSNVSKKDSDHDDQQKAKESLPASDGENSQSEKVCLSAADHFKTLFGGPQLSARNFEHYYEIVKNMFCGTKGVCKSFFLCQIEGLVSS